MPRRDLPLSRYLHDDSVSVPAHFRAPSYAEPDGQRSSAELRRDNEVTLRKALGVRDQHELPPWLVQNWVVDAYMEYTVAVRKVRWPGVE